MSLSVDDLVCSLSSSHIGQEATDLAALQAQLTQAFFGQSSATFTQSPSKNSSSDADQPCNTPTGRTPSTSFSWGSAEVQRFTRRNVEETVDDVEDERMVEDILIPSSPTPAGPSSTFGHQPSFRTHRSHSRSTPISPPTSPSYGTDSSIFTSTDPFYLAQLQAMQTHNASSPTSVFSQLGRPSQQSPFVNQGQKYDSFGYPTSSVSFETHNMLTATAGAFER
ncbi:hypothetical protein V5O48_000792 [Marasmius crinis-equi]|uniref:Uncharacterized protein n=1 Tax=Marasmius crinis-equi TaxID=585013 RepID=A0ABR3G0P7_9AGAR